jgi:hypothetical protein
MFVFAEKANLGVLGFFVGGDEVYYADFKSQQIQRVNIPLEKFSQGN